MWSETAGKDDSTTKLGYNAIFAGAPAKDVIGHITDGAYRLSEESIKNMGEIYRDMKKDIGKQVYNVEWYNIMQCCHKKFRKQNLWV